MNFFTKKNKNKSYGRLTTFKPYKFRPGDIVITLNKFKGKVTDSSRTLDVSIPDKYKVDGLASWIPEDQLELAPKDEGKLEFAAMWDKISEMP